MKKLAFILLALSLMTSAAYADRKGKKEKEDKPKKEKTKKPVKRKEVADLDGPKWVLIEMNGKAVSATGMREAPFLMFTDKGDVVEGFTGCNQINGKYKEGKEGAIKLETMTTKMACADMDTESQLNQALTYGNRYKVNGQHLLLYNDNLILAIFEATYPE